MQAALQSNGRAIIPTAGLTQEQFIALNSQPSSYFSEKTRAFTFIPTPSGLNYLASQGIGLDAKLTAMALRWTNYLLHEPATNDYSKHLATNPWDHQSLGIDFGINCPSPYFDMGMGTGKSLVAAGTLAACEHRRSLILCPKAVVNVWPREFRKHSKGQFIIVPLDYKGTKKKAEEAERWWRLNPSEQMVFILNYESAIESAMTDWLKSRPWDAVIADEIHRTKSPTGKTSKTTAALDTGHPIGLSGTMMPHDPLDVWAQYRFLDPAIFGTSFTMFKKRYCELGFFNEVKKFINIAEMNERINMIRYHVPASVLGLPPATHNMMTFRLSPKMEKAYQRFEKELAAQLDEGLVTADNVLVRGVRCQQITSGFFIDSLTGDMVLLDDRPKASAFEDWLDSVPRNDKAVVFARFKHDIDVIKDVVEKDGRVFGELSGRRNDLTSDATYPPGVDILGVNIQSGGVGVDLTLASHGCYYSVSWNRGDYDQSIARLVRPGQTKHVSFTHLVAEDTVDSEIYDAFSDGRDLVRAVLDGIKQPKCRRL